MGVSKGLMNPVCPHSWPWFQQVETSWDPWRECQCTLLERRPVPADRRISRSKANKLFPLPTAESCCPHVLATADTSRICSSPAMKRSSSTRSSCENAGSLIHGALHQSADLRFLLSALWNSSSRISPQNPLQSSCLWFLPSHFLQEEHENKANQIFSPVFLKPFITSGVGLLLHFHTFTWRWQ